MAGFEKGVLRSAWDGQVVQAPDGRAVAFVGVVGLIGAVVEAVGMGNVGTVPDLGECPYGECRE